MTAGTYALRGGIDESDLATKPIYNANINALKQAFGEGTGICSDLTSTSNVSCNYPIGIQIDSYGTVAFFDWSAGTDSVYCSVDSDGDSHCIQ